MKRRFNFAVLIALAFFVAIAGKPAQAQQDNKYLDFFMGAEIGLSDMNYHRQYDLVISLMPGAKWYLGNHWMVAGGAYIPLVNQIGGRFDGIRVLALDVSKEMKLGPLHTKASAGLFGSERYGVDLKMFLPVAQWFAFEAQAGLTGRCSFRGGNSGHELVMSDMGRFSCTLGGDIYLSRWNTQLRGTVGKYLYRDYGMECEVIRHFKHTSISIYANWNHVLNFDGGFKVVAMIPPYKRTHRKVNFRPMSNFTYDYTARNHYYTNIMYHTDPEENIRDGWFSRDLLQWGSHTMEPDFIYIEKEATK